MFGRARNEELAVDWERRPWWRELSLKGWSVLIVALCSTASFVCGAMFGVVPLFISAKQRSGPVTAEHDVEPNVFILLMAINLLVAIVLWSLFARWLGERRKNAPQSPFATRLESKQRSHDA